MLSGTLINSSIGRIPESSASNAVDDALRSPRVSPYRHSTRSARLSGMRRNDGISINQFFLRLVSSVFTFLLCLVSVGIFYCMNAVAAEPNSVEVTILHSWQGDYPVTALERFPVGQQNSRYGYIGDSTTLEKIWQAFKPEESVPAVQFDNQLVIFSRNIDFYNRSSIAKVLLKQGAIDLLVMETRSALPIEDKVSLALAVIPSAGVTAMLTDGGTIPVTQISAVPVPNHVNVAHPDELEQEHVDATAASTSESKRVLTITLGDVVDPRSMQSEITSMLEDLGYVQQSQSDAKTGQYVQVIEEYGQYRMLFTIADNASVQIDVHIRESDRTTALHFSEDVPVQPDNAAMDYYGELKKRVILEFGADNVSDTHTFFAP